MIFADLRTAEVHTFFGLEHFGSVYYCRICKRWECILCSDVKPLKCILVSDVKNLEVYTIFGSENRGSVFF